MFVDWMDKVPLEGRKEMDRYKEGYNQANRDWEKKIQKEIEELKNMKIEGETFTTAKNYAVLQLQDLLKKG